MVKESVSASPMLMFPPMVTSPVRFELPAISNLPNEPVDDSQPLTLCKFKRPILRRRALLPTPLC